MSIRRVFGRTRPKILTALFVTGALSTAMLALPSSVSADGGPAGVVTAQNANGLFEQFEIGSNCQMYHRYQTSSGGGYSAWYSLGGCLKSGYGLDVGLNYGGRLEVFAIGTNNAVWHDWQTKPSAGPWSGWYSLGGSVISGPTVYSEYSGYDYEEVWVVGTNCYWYYNVQENAGGGPWSGWIDSGSYAGCTMV